MVSRKKVINVAIFQLCFVFVKGIVQNEELVQRGKIQYDLLRKRSNLPQYGSCWKSAVEHLENGCRYLSEHTQSDIALHITNCFLEMSGHPTYYCELDKKSNLRAICINSMSDRAFNVYTEFYTHTQNICWFLQGQIWHEIIADNTIIVGKQLKETAHNQQDLLQAQKESLKLQVKMMEHGELLEKNDLLTKHYELLCLIQRQNNIILSKLENTFIDSQKNFTNEIIESTKENFYSTRYDESDKQSGKSYKLHFKCVNVSSPGMEYVSKNSSKTIDEKSSSSFIKNAATQLGDSMNKGYNLRSTSIL
ncbi:hypothetical protein JTB14_022999 [Gonioctena quinquepunctata]|nr:hypothetical protein JTB14_022999 [Gonioctena quinquepunctata]